ncbi:hypothetical protein [Myceligenerans indicum]|uniref:hypothetical protein n=1 Tax=Myceligenerans indicum TaxID=2593663 RepID=UPI00191DFAC3|nr:hypothetical protein [Myceligenerans indicum]
MEIFAAQGEKPTHRRRPVVVSGVSALVAVVVCGGGLALAVRAGDGDPAVAAATASPLPIPMIMSAEDLDGAGAQDLPGGLAKATARLAEAVRAGEQVYAAARGTAPSHVLETLREALDEASVALDGELDRDATENQRAQRAAELNGLRTQILDAAARITAVRTVPGSELPPGTTTAAVVPDDVTAVGGTGRGEPSAGTAGEDTVRADGAGGSATDGSGPGGGDTSSGGSGGTGGDGGDSGPAPTPAPTPTPATSPTPAPSPAPSSPSPAPSPSPSGSA